VPRIAVRAADGTHLPFVIPAGDTAVGRGKDCGLVVEGEGVSRRHAVLRWDSRVCRIEDAGSLQSVALAHGDEIRLGPALVLDFAADVAPEVGGFPEPERGRSPEPESDALQMSEPGRFPEPESDALQMSEPGRFPESQPDALQMSEPGRFPEPEPGGFPEFEPGAFPEPPRRGSRRGGGWWRGHELSLRTSVAGREVVHRFAHASVTVGTDPDCGLRVQGQGVSRLHARLDRRGGRVTICDLKSAGGTQVNGRRTMRAELADGDRVRLGDVDLLVSVRSTVAWGRIAVLAAVLVGIVATAVITPRVVARVQERQAVAKKRLQVERAALAAIEDGIASYRQRRFDLACGHLRYAADLLLLCRAAPAGATLDHANAFFGPILLRLPAADRGFDFEAVFDSATAAEGRAEIENLSDSAYVLREVQRIAVEVGQSQDVPAGFAEGVWLYVQETMRHPGKFEAALRRSVTIQPVLLRILGEAQLPRVFAYVAWVESDLDRTAGSPAGAVGLWQFMSTTAERYRLRVAGGYDERTNVELSTRAATAYISDLILVFGPEQFMCAMASYNRGEGGVQRAMMQIPQQLTMMPSSKKFWYLVERGLLPDETSRYVPRVFATKIMAENPARFGLSRP
jgi:pSer/pThr/pTyr-binding forkhead associated (FHA) protein/soluble lytic murein transglycosylase-like protein